MQRTERPDRSLVGTADVDLNGFATVPGFLGVSHSLGKCLFDTFPEHGYLLAADRRILAVNDTAVRQLRTSSRVLIGEPFHPMILGPASVARRMLTESLRAGHSRRTEVRLAVPGSRAVDLLMCASLLPAEAGCPASYLVIGVDISRVESELRRSQAMAISDPLTQAYNRRFLERLLEHESARGRRYGYPTGFVIADVDGFKRINDLYGHRTGDEALCRVATQLRRALRASDVLVRYGGDEFLAVLPQTGSEVATAAGRIAHSFADACLRVRREDVPIRVTLGASFWSPNGDGRTMQDAIEEADAQLYARRRAQA